MADDLIEFSTEGGSWSYRAEKEGDPYFSDYIESLREVGDLPSSIVFRSSLAEVIEDEWDNYILLREYIHTSIEDGKYLNAQLSYLSPFSRLWTLDDVEHWNIPGITLPDIDRIQRIVNMPEYWRLSAMTGRADLVEAKNHILLLANNIEEVYGASFRVDPDWQGIDTLDSIVNQLYQSNEEDKAIEGVAVITMAVARDAAMMKLWDDPKAQILSAKDIRWDLLEIALHERGVGEDSATYCLALTFLGRGGLKMEVASLLLSVSQDEPVTLSLDEGERGTLSFVYDSVFSPLLSYSIVFPFLNGEVETELSPQQMNLGGVTNQLIKTIPWVNTNVAGLLLGYDGQLGPDSFTDRATILQYVCLLDHFIVGRQNLERLARLNPSGHEEFQLILFEYLTMVPSPRAVLGQFPKPVDVNRVKTFVNRLSRR